MRATQRVARICLFSFIYRNHLTSSKLNDIDNQILYYTMVQIW